MDGKKYFQDRCKTLGIDHKTLVKLGQTGRYFKAGLSHSFDPAQRTENHRYVICYFETMEIYVAWDLRADKSRGQKVFSLGKDKILGIVPGKVMPVAKSKEFSGWGAEMVYVFRRDGVDAFIQKYLAQ